VRLLASKLGQTRRFDLVLAACFSCGRPPDAHRGLLLIASGHQIGLKLLLLDIGQHRAAGAADVVHRRIDDRLRRPFGALAGRPIGGICDAVSANFCEIEAQPDRQIAACDPPRPAAAPCPAFAAMRRPAVPSNPTPKVPTQHSPTMWANSEIE